jgi:hypothetical protein
MNVYTITDLTDLMLIQLFYWSPGKLFLQVFTP